LPRSKENRELFRVVFLGQGLADQGREELVLERGVPGLERGTVRGAQRAQPVRDEPGRLEPVERVGEVVGLPAEWTSPIERSTGPLGSSSGVITVETSIDPGVPGWILSLRQLFRIGGIQPISSSIPTKTSTSASLAALMKLGLASRKWGSSCP